jgi:hypothetical protein
MSNYARDIENLLMLEEDLVKNVEYTGNELNINDGEVWIETILDTVAGPYKTWLAIIDGVLMWDEDL